MKHFGKPGRSRMLCGQPQAPARAVSATPASVEPAHDRVARAESADVPASVAIVRVVACALLAGSVGCAPAGAQGISPQPVRLAKAVKFIAAQRGELGIPGLSAAIVLDDKLVWSGGFGLADVENNVPARADTVYRIASISIPITAIAALELVDSGRLNLTANVRDYVPELPDKGKTITLHHLLTHQSGLRTYMNAKEALSRVHYGSLLDALTVFQDDPLVAPPGEVFLFTPFGYTMVGLVIERAAGQSLGAYLEEHIFEPLGMKNTAVENPRAIVPNRARGYAKKRDGKLRNSDFVDLSIKAAAAGMISTAPDLARFAIGISTNKLLSPEMTKIMWTPHKTTRGKQTRYGLGWTIREIDERRAVGHGGPLQQVSTVLLILPKERTAVVMLANLEGVNMTELAAATVRILVEP